MLLILFFVCVNSANVPGMFLSTSSKFLEHFLAPLFLEHLTWYSYVPPFFPSKNEMMEHPFRLRNSIAFSSGQMGNLFCTKLSVTQHDKAPFMTVRLSGCQTSGREQFVMQNYYLLNYWADVCMGHTMFNLSITDPVLMPVIQLQRFDERIPLSAQVEAMSLSVPKGVPPACSEFLAIYKDAYLTHVRNELVTSLNTRTLNFLSFWHFKLPIGLERRLQYVSSMLEPLFSSRLAVGVTALSKTDFSAYDGRVHPPAVNKECSFPVLRGHDENQMTLRIGSCGIESFILSSEWHWVASNTQFRFVRADLNFAAGTLSFSLRLKKITSPWRTNPEIGALVDGMMHFSLCFGDGDYLSAKMISLDPLRLIEHGNVTQSDIDLTRSFFLNITDSVTVSLIPELRKHTKIIGMQLEHDYMDLRFGAK